MLVGCRWKKSGESECTYNVGRREQEHRDHSILDDLIRRLFLVIEREHTYHEEREIYA